MLSPVQRTVASFCRSNCHFQAVGRGFESVPLPTQSREVRKPHRNALSGVHELSFVGKLEAHKSLYEDDA